MSLLFVLLKLTFSYNELINHSSHCFPLPIHQCQQCLRFICPNSFLFFLFCPQHKKKNTHTHTTKHNLVKPATCVSELAEFYRDSCKRHHVRPIDSIMKHLDTLDLNSNSRRPVLNLREQNLTAESCEALEELLKRVSKSSKLVDIITFSVL